MLPVFAANHRLCLSFISSAIALAKVEAPAGATEDAHPG